MPIPLIIAIVSTLLAGGGGTAVVASKSNPGDNLYPVKLWGENIRVSLTSDGEVDDLRADLADKRIKEITDMVSSSNSGSNDAEDRSKGLRMAIGNFEDHISEIDKSAKSLAESGEVDRSLRIRERINIEIESLKKIMEQEGISGSDMNTMLGDELSLLNELEIRTKLAISELARDDSSLSSRENELRGRALEAGEDIRGNSDENEIRGSDSENELRGRANEPGEDIRGNSDENEIRGRESEAELRGRANEAGEDVQGNTDENEIRGQGIEAGDDRGTDSASGSVSGSVSGSLNDSAVGNSVSGGGSSGGSSSGGSESGSGSSGGSGGGSNDD